MSELLTRLAKRLFLQSLEGLQGGCLEMVEEGRTQVFGDGGAALRARIVVHRPRFFRRAVFGGSVGLGEAWMDGDWSSPTLVEVIRLAVRNLALLEEKNRLLSACRRSWDVVRHRLRGNSVAGSRRNIRAHYDLSNDFFRLFLDGTMMYSCAYYEDEEAALETAQVAKLDRICKKLRLAPEDHILEIGTGWGGFAEYAATHYGCRVTTTTISREQHEFARQRFVASPAGGRIELLQQDYRHLEGQYDKIVSIEMFEAVGLEYYDEFFGACDRLLRPGGSLLLQTITIQEQAFAAYHRSSDWIQTYIFPGAELASVLEILRSLARATSLGLYHAEEIGTHYARTLAAWRARFREAEGEVRALGFDERFLRMWDYYLGYCEGAFLERHIGDFQLVLTKAHTQKVLYGEPWGEGAGGGTALYEESAIG